MKTEVSPSYQLELVTYIFTLGIQGSHEDVAQNRSKVKLFDQGALIHFDVFLQLLSPLLLQVR